MAGTKNWREVRGQRALNEDRVELYSRLMDAERLLADAAARRGLSEDEISEALFIAEPEWSAMESGEDVYITTLAHHAAALGGHLEVQAVFPDQTVTLFGTHQSADRVAE